MRGEQSRGEQRIFFPPSFDVLVRYNFPLNLGMSKNIVEARLFHLTGEGKHVYGSKGRSAMIDDNDFMTPVAFRRLELTEFCKRFFL